jgi:hypothetical protein
MRVRQTSRGIVNRLDRNNLLGGAKRIVPGVEPMLSGSGSYVAGGQSRQITEPPSTTVRNRKSRLRDDRSRTPGQDGAAQTLLTLPE